jgi:FKBP-type peptidyl-prolyl cis-trans isomerase
VNQTRANPQIFARVFYSPKALHRHFTQARDGHPPADLINIPFRFMKFKLQAALVLIASLSISAVARQLAIDTPAPSGPPDKEKLSYAMGMNLGLQRKESGSTMDVDSFIQGLKDVLEGKPTQIKESDLPQLMFEARRSSSDNRYPAPDQKKVAYALGMRMAMQLKRTEADLDDNAIAQGLNDVVQGKPTQLKETEIAPLFNQAKTYTLAKQSEKNSAEGKAFLAKNVKEPGVTVLPDGLQYKILEAGTGKIPETNDIVVITYRGTMVDGREVERRNEVRVRVISQIKGFQEALQKMKAGSKWQLCVPPELAYGRAGLNSAEIGPDATLVYELELNEISPPLDQVKGLGTGRLGHGLGDGNPPENAAKPTGQTNAPPDKTSVSK